MTVLKKKKCFLLGTLLRLGCSPWECGGWTGQDLDSCLAKAWGGEVLSEGSLDDSGGSAQCVPRVTTLMHATDTETW